MGYRVSYRPVNGRCFCAERLVDLDFLVCNCFAIYCRRYHVRERKLTSLAFRINLPIIGSGTLAIIFFLKLAPTHGALLSKIKRFDWLGSTFFIASTVSFLIPLTWGGIMYSWSSWRVLFPIIIGPAGIICFAFYERYLSHHAWDKDGNALPGNNIEPIIRFSIFNNMTMVLTYLETVIHGIVVWSLLYFLPLYYEAVKGYTPIIAGVAVLPETFLVARKFLPHILHT